MSGAWHEVVGLSAVLDGLEVLIEELPATVMPATRLVLAVRQRPSLLNGWRSLEAPVAPGLWIEPRRLVRSTASVGAPELERGNPWGEHMWTLEYAFPGVASEVFVASMYREALCVEAFSVVDGARRHIGCSLVFGADRWDGAIAALEDVAAGGRDVPQAVFDLMRLSKGA